jgi:type IV pilus assembly protein PilB
MLLIRDGLVSSEELEEVLARQGDDREQRISSQRLGEALVAKGTVTSAQIARLVAEQHDLPFVDLDEPDAMVPVPVRLPEAVARSHCAVPIRAFPDGSVLVVVGDPTLPRCFDAVRAALGVPVRFAVAAPDAIVAAIETVVASTAVAEAAADDVHEDEPPASDVDTDDLIVLAREVRNSVARVGASGTWPLLGSLLLRDGLVSADELYAVLAQQRLSSTKRLGEILVARGSLTEEQLSRALAEQHELPFVELEESEIDRAAASLLPLDVARAHLALPISYAEDGALLVVVADPATAVHADEVREQLGVPLQFAVAMSEDIDAAIDSLAADEGEGVDEPFELAVATSEDEEAAAAPESPTTYGEPEDAPFELAVGTSEYEYEDEDVDAALESWATDESEPEDEPFELAEASEPPTTDAGPPPTAETNGTEEVSARPGAVSDALEEAVALGASAVHFTRGTDGLAVRARIDGTVTDLQLLSGSEADAAVTTLAELAVVGRDAVVADDGVIELRPTTLATTLGRRTTFRIVTEEHRAAAFDDVFPEDVGRTLRDALERPAGLVLISGSAAASRATALRTVMREVVSPERVVLSVEDPVEFVVSGVGQAEVNLQAGLTYPAVLQAILRSDPDVAVVAELPDHETARLTVRGARDRLVLTTLDAPTPASALLQLSDLGIAPKALADTIAVVVGHAEVRRLCDKCRESYYASEDELVELGRPLDELGRRLLGRGRGCEGCDGSGYRDDIDIFEALPVSAELAGVRTLRDRAVDLCLDGLTATEELRRLSLSGTS